MGTEAGEQPLIGTRLEFLIDLDHELIRLSQTINWEAIASEFRPMDCPDNGRPAVPTRLMAGLQLLKHMFNLSDEQVVVRWTENPYWQFFCGEEFFRHKLPINPSQMTRWHQRIGEKGVEKLLQITIEAGKATRTIPERSLEKVSGHHRSAQGDPASDGCAAVPEGSRNPGSGLLVKGEMAIH